ncbi:inosine 5-monophosphate dehydrogenase [candidate division WOR-1 bacterium RIFOXYA12_FULL_43_27]|uniref:Inosine 5-monophosphate dehydrogenase n=1 Tax=candidate division WOR-1 bacterium RIFOXYC2_FULL_46_14 TaxID=1802587 RepID=A0A1F4U3M3_UNCSA|nr:MAG: inosine 5-monophosphate dehydrogenase [candidate division WOR-1 bacterium RIFOXYA12_FULL_43_27]OGC20086.1 MAG: inosine 5-monophosphate dehydrogenase [candidate division WOR-1 bacterium RIFOXYB2_FULL_46_45]OGC32178.1 MAG: inosine 5-monophosphate dehydrogenase [candidate division WOR-1 bacterium RIFOXYA2_FULL_46_56]OGC39578.1 MAG: inosine 5-monophosphate dehydrogenase [candidate division WOR-1 bacterium RIFOXYC2_FULL_46_14]
METKIGGNKATRRVYGFEEIALVPSIVTVNPDDADISWELGGHKFEMPLIASAMDSVVDPGIAVLLSQYGGLGVLNLEGVQTRYEDANSILEQIAKVEKAKYVELMQKLYEEPIKKELIAKRIKEIKSKGGIVAVSSTPQRAKEFGTAAKEAGADFFVLQSTVISTKHKSKTSKPLDLPSFCKEIKIPVLVGNCVTYEVALTLMGTGVAGVLVGIGPGAACTSRGVLGIGIPMATAIAECAAARDSYFKENGVYVPIIADGGMVVSGDVCKALACGADAVMIGSPIAKSKEAPGRGFHWGMATPNATLPRGSRIAVGTIGSLKEILLGPARFDDGSMNIVGAIKTSMGTLGASNLKEMQRVEVVIAPSNATEGKVYQKAQQLGMYK